MVWAFTVSLVVNDEVILFFVCGIDAVCFSEETDSVWELGEIPLSAVSFSDVDEEDVLVTAGEDVTGVEIDDVRV